MVRKQDVRTVAHEMANLIRLSLFCSVFIVPSLPRLEAMRPFWRRTTTGPKPTLLPPLNKNPEFYRKLREDIPPLNETAQKVVTNLFQIRPGGKRQVNLEDGIIVMDGSGSVGLCEFDNGKKAIKNMLAYNDPGVDAKYAVVTFSTNARIDFGFSQKSLAAINISAVRYPGGSTNTQAGLAEALNLFNTGSRGFSSRKLVLLLTDGQSNIQQPKTIPNAERLKSRGVEVFVVAVGGQHMSGIDEMAHVASYPPANYLFRVEKEGDLLKVMNLAIKEVAPDQYKILDKYVSSCSG